MTEREFKAQLRACYLQLAAAEDAQAERRAWLRLAKLITRRYDEPPAQ